MWTLDQAAQSLALSLAAADALWVRANDGTTWGPWSQALTVTVPTDNGPVVTSVSSINTIAGQTFAASALFTASDPFGDPIEQYDFWDTGSVADNSRAMGNHSAPTRTTTFRQHNWRRRATSPDRAPIRSGCV
jgi:hypothetical protein